MTPPIEPEWARSNWQSYCVWLSHRVRQREIMQSMLDEGIATRRGVMCTHRQPAYATQPWLCGACARVGSSHEHAACLAVSERAEDGAVLLPLYSQMTDQEQDRVVTALQHALSAVAAA